MTKKGYQGLALELIYQWIGCWVTPHWWSDALVNKALASFIAAETVFDVKKFQNKIYCKFLINV